MSIVPDQLAQAWGEQFFKEAQCTQSRAEYIANRAAEWALRRAASECDEFKYFRAADVIRALMKGGESDEN